MRPNKVETYHIALAQLMEMKSCENLSVQHDRLLTIYINMLKKVYRFKLNPIWKCLGYMSKEVYIYIYICLNLNNTLISIISYQLIIPAQRTK